MVTLTENVNAFDIKLYQSLSEIAAGYARDNASGQLIGRIPLAPGILDNATQYKKPLFEETQGVTGGVPSLGDFQMMTSQDTRVYPLKNVNATLHWDPEDQMADGKYLVQKQREQLAEWARQANISIMKGVYKAGIDNAGLGSGTKLIDGVLDNCTMVLNLDGTNSALTTAGDVYTSLVNFLTAIPYRFRAGKKIILGASPHFYDMANSATYTYNNGETEWEQFFRIHVKGASPMKVSEDIIWSDDLFLDTGALVGDATNSTNYDCADGSRDNTYTRESDTLGTSDRLFAMIAEPNIVERAYSKGFGIRGEAKNYVGGITQSWTVKEAGCVHRPLAVLYSESITWT